MSKEVFVFEVNQKSFDQAVMLNSHKIPVLVEFMGVWSGPCIAMDTLFSGLAKEFSEQFVFAKVDIDEQPELSKTHKIENVPTLMVFKDGQCQRTEVGELKENEARALLKDFGIFHESDRLREAARGKHLAGDSATAIMQLTEAIKLDPGNTRVAMDMVQVFVDIGEVEQAQSLFERLPEATRETEMGKALSGQLLFAGLAARADDMDTLRSRLATSNDDLDARFDLAVHQIALYKYNEAIDNLFMIYSQDAEYKEGAAKEMIITVANMIAPVNMELAQDIRRKLANLTAG